MFWISKSVRWTLNCQQSHTNWNEKNEHDSKSSVYWHFNTSRKQTSLSNTALLEKYFHICLLVLRNDSWGTYSQKGRKKNTPVIAEQQHFKYYYKKKKRKKICKVQHIKGANENNKKKCCIAYLLWFDYSVFIWSLYFLNLAVEYRLASLSQFRKQIFFFDQSQNANPPQKNPRSIILKLTNLHKQSKAELD